MQLNLGSIKWRCPVNLNPNEVLFLNDIQKLFIINGISFFDSHFDTRNRNVKRGTFQPASIPDLRWNTVREEHTNIILEGLKSSSLGSWDT